MNQTPAVFRDSDFNNLEYVRQIVLKRLKDDTRWNQFDRTWDEHHQKFVSFDPGRLRDRFVVLANEIMWQLIIQGVITVGIDAANPNLPFFRITDYGQEVLKAGRLIPHDPTGYLDELKAIKGDVPSFVMSAYIEEALKCFTAGCHVASVLLLGVAAESVFNHMCDSVGKSLKSTNEKKTLRGKRTVHERHVWLVEKYNNLPGKDKKQLPESLGLTLSSLYNLIRNQRNELGHPRETPPDMSREDAFISFRVFPGFVRDAQKFSEYCRDNRI